MWFPTRPADHDTDILICPAVYALIRTFAGFVVSDLALASHTNTYTMELILEFYT